MGWGTMRYAGSGIGQGLNAIANAIGQVQAMKMNALLQTAQMKHNERIRKDDRDHEKAMLELRTEAGEHSFLMRKGFLNKDGTPNYDAYAEYTDKIREYESEMQGIQKELSETTNEERKRQLDFYNSTYETRVDALKEDLKQARQTRTFQKYKIDEHKDNRPLRDEMNNLGIQGTKLDIQGKQISNEASQTELDDFNAAAPYREEGRKIDIESGRLGLDAGKAEFEEWKADASYRAKSKINQLNAQELQNLATSVNIETGQYNLQYAKDTDALRKRLMNNEAALQEIARIQSEINLKELQDTSLSRVKAQNTNNRLQDMLGMEQMDPGMQGIRKSQPSWERSIEEWRTGISQQNADTNTANANAYSSNLKQSANAQKALADITNTLGSRTSELQELPQATTADEYYNSDQASWLDKKKYNAVKEKGSPDPFGIGAAIVKTIWGNQVRGKVGEINKQKAQEAMTLIDQESKKRRQIFIDTVNRANREYGTNITYSQALQDPVLNKQYGEAFMYQAMSENEKMHYTQEQLRKMNEYQLELQIKQNKANAGK